MDGVVCEAVVVCDGYDDYLRITLPKLAQQVTQVALVTSARDTATQGIGKAIPNCKVVISKHLETSFRKGSAINDGIAVLDRTGWMLFTDADMLFPSWFDFSQLEKHKLYTVPRRRVVGEVGLERYLAGDRDHGEVIYQLNRLGPTTPLGYCQLLHFPTNPVKYPSKSDGADSDDMQLAKKFPVHDRYMLPQMSYHLETEDARKAINWKGRATRRFGRLMLRNHLTGSLPVHVHCNGSKEYIGESFKLSESMFNECNSVRFAEYAAPLHGGSLAIATFWNKSSQPLAYTSARKFGFRCNVLGRQHSRWKNKLKTVLALEFLKRTSASYVMFVDGSDSLFVRSPQVAANYLSLSPHSVIVSAEKGDWPPGCPVEPLREPYRYANSGGVIGAREALIELYTKALDYPHENDDQHGVRIAAEKLPFVQVDIDANVFQTLAYMKQGELSVEEYTYPS